MEWHKYAPRFKILIGFLWPTSTCTAAEWNNKENPHSIFNDSPSSVINELRFQIVKNGHLYFHFSNARLGEKKNPELSNVFPPTCAQFSPFSYHTRENECGCWWKKSTPFHFRVVMSVRHRHTSWIAHADFPLRQFEKNTADLNNKTLIESTKARQVSNLFWFYFSLLIPRILTIVIRENSVNIAIGLVNYGHRIRKNKVPVLIPTKTTAKF